MLHALLCVVALQPPPLAPLRPAVAIRRVQVFRMALEAPRSERERILLESIAAEITEYEARREAARRAEQLRVVGGRAVAASLLGDNAGIAFAVTAASAVAGGRAVLANNRLQRELAEERALPSPPPVSRRALPLALAALGVGGVAVAAMRRRPTSQRLRAELAELQEAQATAQEAIEQRSRAEARLAAAEARAKDEATARKEAEARQARGAAGARGEDAERGLLAPVLGALDALPGPAIGALVLAAGGAALASGGQRAAAAAAEANRLRGEAQTLAGQRDAAMSDAQAAAARAIEIEKASEFRLAAALKEFEALEAARAAAQDEASTLDAQRQQAQAELSEAQAALRRATTAAERASAVEQQLREEAAGLVRENEKLRRTVARSPTASATPAPPTPSTSSSTAQEGAPPEDEDAAQ